MVNVHGEQYHHNHPSELTDQLYLAAARAISARVLLDLGITCIINATLELPTMAYHNQDCLQIAVEDRVASKLYVYFDLVADKIHSVHNTPNGKTMIYCRAGMSRSASLCIAYFIKYHKMSMEDAFEYVRKRRPIIHPNVGFMRQLRDYEKKLRSNNNISSSSSSSSSKECDASLLSSMVFAEEAKGERYEEDSDLKVIKPRPQPRQPRIRLSDVLEQSAETYQITLVELCSTNEDSNNHPCAVVAAVSSSNNNSNSNDMVLAEKSHQHCLEYAAGLHMESEAEEERKKTAFTKISEPAKIAVSFIILLLDSDDSGSSNNNNTATTTTSNNCNSLVSNLILASSISVFAELLPLPEVTQEIAFECLGKVSQTVTSENHYCSTKAFISITLPSLLSPETIIPETFHCCGALQQQQKCLLPIRQPPQPLPAPAKRPMLTRTASTTTRRPSIKMSPNKRKVEAAADYLILCQCLVDPIVWDSAVLENHTEPSKYTTAEVTVTDMLSFAAAASECEDLFELVVRDPHSNFRPGWLLTVARKTVISSISLEVNLDMVMEVEEVLSVSVSVLPGREFPYYSLVKRNQEEVVLSKAMELPNIETCYFVTLAPRKSTKTVCMVPKVEELKPKSSSFKRRAVEPVLRWASERFHIDVTSSFHTCKAMEAVEVGKASVRYGGVRFRLSYSSRDEAHFVTEEPVLIPKLQFQKYSSCSVSNMCHYPNFGMVASVDNLSSLLEMNNLYSEPRTLKCRCSCEYQDLEYVSVAAEVESYSIGVFKDDSMDLVEIPDVIDGDIGLLKQRLLTQRDPVKIAIWLDVFKRSVIRARPIYPIISVSEMLAVAEVEEVGVEEAVEDMEDMEEIDYSQPHLSLEAVFSVEVVLPDVAEMWDDECEESSCQIATATQSVSLSLVLKASYTSTVTPLEALFIMSTPQRVKYLPTFATLRIAAPFLSIADADEQINFGSCVSDGDSSIPQISECLKTPFTVLTAMLNSAVGFVVETMSEEEDLSLVDVVPKPADTAMTLTHIKQQQQEMAVISTADVFWFFEVSKASNYQLFLPDPDSAEMLNTDLVVSEEKEDSVPSLRRPRDFQRLDRRMSVTARNRSELLHPSAVTAAEDRRAFANLNATVKHSSSLLEGRRSRSVCRNNMLEPTAAAAAETSSASKVTLRGLLDVAQTWVGPGPKSTGAKATGSVTGAKTVGLKVGGSVSSGARARGARR